MAEADIQPIRKAATPADWNGFLDGPKQGSELYTHPEDPDDPQARAELDKLMAMTLSQGYPMIFHATPGKSRSGAVPERDLPFGRAQSRQCLPDLASRQTSLNSAQAHVDDDGKFRAVISGRDPGIANWLDTGGFARGSVVGRWLEASSHPTPSMRLVKLADLDALLPAGTARVRPEERQAALRRRRAAVQRWRRW